MAASRQARPSGRARATPPTLRDEAAALEHFFGRNNAPFPKVYPNGNLKLLRGNGFVCVLGPLDGMRAHFDAVHPPLSQLGASTTSEVSEIVSLEVDRSWKWERDWNSPGGTRAIPISDLRYRKDEWAEGDAAREFAVVPASILMGPHNPDRTARFYAAVREEVSRRNPDFRFSDKPVDVAYKLHGPPHLLQRLSQRYGGPDATGVLVLLQDYPDSYVLDAPGGKRYLGESSRAAAAREMVEETGLNLDDFPEVCASEPYHKHTWFFVTPESLQDAAPTPTEAPAAAPAAYVPPHRRRGSEPPQDATSMPAEAPAAAPAAYVPPHKRRNRQGGWVDQTPARRDARAVTAKAGGGGGKWSSCEQPAGRKEKESPTHARW